MEEIRWPFWELTEEHSVGLPLVSIDFKFDGQVTGGDQVEIELETALGESGVQFNYRATHNGEVVFNGTELRVCVPVDGDRGIPIPDDLRNALEAGV